MAVSRRFAAVFVLFAAAGALGGWLYARQPNEGAHKDGEQAEGEGEEAPTRRKRSNRIDCNARVTRAELERSVDLGAHYMVAHQKKAGNFDYEYDWKKKTYSEEDSAPRQAGALWGLSLLNAYYGKKASPDLVAAVKKGIAYFDDRSRATAAGTRYPVYTGDGDKPDGEKGGVGMAALVTLGIVDYVRTLPPGEERTKMTARANEYINFIAGLNTTEGLWPGDYKYDTGEGVGVHSPYSDGEALLALVVAMKYLGRDDLKPLIEKAAKEGHDVNVDKALEKSKDSTTTKGYYQWSSMSYYELATSSQLGGPTAPYGQWVMALADWILDVHTVIDKPRNTGYAYEGIVSAYAWAKKIQDPRAAKFLCAIHTGLGNLMAWQVGNTRARALGGEDDFKAVGGVQNHATESPLRIDVVQHQMHGEMLAIEHVALDAPAATSGSAAPPPSSSK